RSPPKCEAAGKQVGYFTTTTAAAHAWFSRRRSVFAGELQVPCVMRVIERFLLSKVSEKNARPKIKKAGFLLGPGLSGRLSAPTRRSSRPQGPGPRSSGSQPTRFAAAGDTKRERFVARYPLHCFPDSMFLCSDIHGSLVRFGRSRLRAID